MRIFERRYFWLVLLILEISLRVVKNILKDLIWFLLEDYIFEDYIFVW